MILLSYDELIDKKQSFLEYKNIFSKKLPFISLFFSNFVATFILI